MRSVCLATLGFLLALSVLAVSCKTDDSPGFFLKISKNVPRLGRRSESYFLKNMKTIPRIGRSASDNVSNSLQAFYDWLDDTTPTLSKRVLLGSAAATAVSGSEYSVVQPINVHALMELLSQNALPANSIRFVHWKDFDRALQADGDLFSKVSELGRKPDQRLREDLSYNYAGGRMQANTPEYGTDFMYYNKGANGDSNSNYPNKYDRELIRYNYL